MKLAEIKEGQSFILHKDPTKKWKAVEVLEEQVRAISEELVDVHGTETLIHCTWLLSKNERVTLVSE